MKIRFLLPTIFLAAKISFTSCSAQIRTAAPKDSVGEPAKLSPAGQPKLVRSQGTGQYANIFCGLFDHAGNIWFGTMGEGAYRYDGRSFTQFTAKNGLCNNYVYAIMEDTAGNIWFGTGYGICRYDGTNFSSLPIVVRDANHLLSYPLPAGQFTINQYGNPAMENTVWSLMQDKKGTYWFGTTTGVYCYNGSTFTRFPDKSNVVNEDSLHLKMIDCMLQDKNGNIWFCSGMLPGNEGICRYDGKSLAHFKPNGDGWIRKVIEDKNGQLYFATRHKGVCRYDGENFTNFTEKAGIDNASVNTVFQDRSGNIWMGTELGSGEIGENGGAWRYDGKSFTRFSTQNGLVHNGVFCILEDQSGNIWFGTRNIGLCRYDGKNFTRFSE